MSDFGRVTPEEEIKLGHKIQAGDQNAVDALVKANLRIVLKIAKEYKNL